MITLSEESRRMQDMMKMYSMPGMDMSAFGGEGETLILNANHPLVQYITEHQDGENAEMICEQLYDLAKLQHAPLSADAMTKFVARSNDIMMLLTNKNDGLKTKGITIWERFVVPFLGYTAAWGQMQTGTGISI